MDLEQIRAHWKDWAATYREQLRATTKASTAKLIEVDALARAIRAIEEEKGTELKVLEMGCGNGQNCFNLITKFPNASFVAVDYVAEMIEAATRVKKEKNVPDSQLEFREGDVLNVDLPPSSFDVAFTDRCLINLNTNALQQQAIQSLANTLKPAGHLLMIENSKETYDDQNEARKAVGLPPRTPAEFNHFFEEETLIPFLSTIGLELYDVEDIISLHDLVLYVLLPMVNGGKVDYESPLVEAAAQLNIALSALRPNSVGAYGQNRFYKCRKVA